MKRSNAFDRIHISLDSYGCVTGATFPDGLTMASLVVENSKVWENLHARARENGNQRDQIAGLEAELASTVQTVLEKDVEIAQLEMSKEHWISSSNFYREQADEIKESLLVTTLKVTPNLDEQSFVDAGKAAGTAFIKAFFDQISWKTEEKQQR